MMVGAVVVVVVVVTLVVIVGLVMVLGCKWTFIQGRNWLLRYF